MRGKPLYPFAMIAALGIGLIIVLSFIGVNVGPDVAGDNGEPAEEQEFDSPIELGERVYQDSCLACHGGDFEGGGGPALGAELSKDDILNAIADGPGTMPADLATGADAEAVAEYILAENE